MDAIGFNQVEAFAAKQKYRGWLRRERAGRLNSQGLTVNELRVADYVQLTANGLLSSEMTIQDEPDLVRSMARALARGIADTIANPDRLSRSV